MLGRGLCERTGFCGGMGVHTMAVGKELHPQDMQGAENHREVLSVGMDIIRVAS
jgi:hypothetical protein